MSRIPHLLARIAGSVVGLLIGGATLGGLAVLVVCQNHFALAMDSPSLFLGGPAFLVGATLGAAVGATAVQGAWRHDGSFSATLAGAMGGLAIGCLLGTCYWLAAIHVDVCWDGRAFFLAGAALCCIPVSAGAVIGAGWKAKAKPAAESRGS